MRRPKKTEVCMCALRHCFCIAYYSCTPEKARPGSLRFTIFQCILQAGTKARLLYRASRYNCPLFSLPERPLKVECFPKKGWKKLKSRREYKESITALRQLNTTFFLWPLMNLESCRKNEKTSLGSWDKTAKLWPISLVRRGKQLLVGKRLVKYNSVKKAIWTRSQS